LSDEHKEILVHWLLKIFFQRLFCCSLTSCIWLYWSLFRSLINSFYFWDWDSVVVCWTSASESVACTSDRNQSFTHSEFVACASDRNQNFTHSESSPCP
jgi:hypothetical protein